MTTVHEVMSISPVTVKPATSVAELLVLFDRHDFNAFPVLDQQEQLLGIVSKLDVLELFLAAGGPGPATDAPNTVRVENFMHRDVVSVEAREPIAEAGAVMVAKRLRSLPVIERRERGVMLVGILSRGDVLRGLRFQLVDGRQAEQGMYAGPRVGGGRREASQTQREAVETLIDDIGAQSFPASDPPAWGVVSSRLAEASRISPPKALEG